MIGESLVPTSLQHHDLFSLLSGGSNGKFKTLTVSAEQLEYSRHSRAPTSSKAPSAEKTEESVKFVFVDSLGERNIVKYYLSDVLFNIIKVIYALYYTFSIFSLPEGYFEQPQQKAGT